ARGRGERRSGRGGDGSSEVWSSEWGDGEMGGGGEGEMGRGGGGEMGRGGDGEMGGEKPLIRVC
ncbi:hypothetical protein, partial [Okeania sp. SIO3B5]|uniref:hypothetical protein n=1 Tax=Okeania sp. SIO3B5 TaxID=2607811 RepID=UPI002600FD0B